jgi:histidinol-phosphate phosphatase family protein
MSLFDLKFDQTWSLFLDRDGVINRRRTDDYVKSWSEFEFLPGVTEAFPLLSDHFGRIIVVTNQQGIGKGIMTREDVDLIHAKMLEKIREAGGRIDAIYLSPYLEKENHPFRKPNTGMALAAQQDFPDIAFSRSVIAGDTASDMEFGRRSGMVRVLVSGSIEGLKGPEIPCDLWVEDLIHFAKALHRV